MAGLRWIVVGILSLAGGYFGYKITGSWIGVPIAAVATAFASARLFAGEIASPLMALCVGGFALFQFIGSSAPDHPKLSTQQAGQGGTNQGKEMASVGPGTTASGPPTKEAANDNSKSAANSPGSYSATEMKAGTVFKDCPTCPELVVLPAGQFVMGSPANEKEAPADGMESPQRKVAVRRFAAGQDAVSRGQFAAFVKSAGYRTDAERLGGCFALSSEKWDFKPQLNWRKPGIAQTDDHPAVCVSWNDANAYVEWLGAANRQTYRLLTEAEREYATRAGSTQAYWWGDTITMMQANFNGPKPDSSDAGKAVWRKTTVPTRHFSANSFGLHNVHGNVWEWVQDCYHDGYTGAPADSAAWTERCTSTKRGVRGGGWASPADGLRSAKRIWLEPDLPTNAGGFRIARDLK